MERFYGMGHEWGQNGCGTGRERGSGGVKGGDIGVDLGVVWWVGI